MARYTGPKSRIARKFGEGIFGADKVLSKKNYPPGQHGNSRKRKTSEYGVQLREKQKAKYTYGVLEKQFRNLFEKAATAKGITGEVLLQLLEGRLDNVVFRLGIAPTRAAARQLVSHKHITVDGEVVNIPSFAVKPGQLIGVRERSKSLEVIANSLAGFNHSIDKEFSVDIRDNTHRRPLFQNDTCSRKRFFRSGIYHLTAYFVHQCFRINLRSGFKNNHPVHLVLHIYWLVPQNYGQHVTQCLILHINCNQFLYINLCMIVEKLHFCLHSQRIQDLIQSHFFHPERDLRVFVIVIIVCPHAADKQEKHKCKNRKFNSTRM